jgi:hypothetical protein
MRFFSTAATLPLLALISSTVSASPAPILQKRDTFSMGLCTDSEFHGLCAFHERDLGVCYNFVGEMVKEASSVLLNIQAGGWCDLFM